MLHAVGGSLLTSSRRSREDGSDSLVSYVDDLIITGTPGPTFEQLKNALRERFRVGSWKVLSVCLCGVQVHKKGDHTDWTIACGSVERDAINNFTSNDQNDQRDK